MMYPAMTTPTLCIRSPITWMKAARTLMFSSEPPLACLCLLSLCQNFHFRLCPLSSSPPSPSSSRLASSVPLRFLLRLFEWPCPWLWGCSTIHMLCVEERKRERESDNSSHRKALIATCTGLQDIHKDSNTSGDQHDIGINLYRMNHSLHCLIKQHPCDYPDN